MELLSVMGTALGAIGPHNASAAAVGSNGNMFFALPGDSSSTVQEYDAAQNLISSFVFAPPSDPRPSAAYIEDMTWGPGGWIWISTFSGNVYSFSTAGVLQGSFDTGTSSPGIATDGTFLYTTEGAGFLNPASHFYRRDTAGNILDSIDTGLNDTLGIGFDSASGTFWIGGFDMLSHVDASGSILDQFAVDGVHTGVEVTSSPEPATFVLIAFSLATLFLYGRKKASQKTLACVAAAICASSLGAAVTTPAIATLPELPQPVGASITFMASATDIAPGPIRYRFRVRPAAGTFSTVRDFAPNAALVWTPADTDGLFEIEVTAKNLTTGSTAVSSQTFQVLPLATGAPVVSATAHPLVALYSAPPCPAGSSMRVRFKLAADIAWQSTNLKACGSGTMNFYIGGMRATSTYQLRHDVIAGASITTGPTLTFTTGAVGVALPAVTSSMPMHSPTNTTDGVTLFGVLSSVSHFPQFAIDSTGHVIWYSLVDTPYATRPVPGGTFLQLYGFTADLGNSGFREIDLAGNLVKETNIECLNSQLALMGNHPITVVHHEARRLANGNYLVLAMTERMSTAQGAFKDIAGDVILVLNPDLQVLWAWDSFDHLDTSRKAVLNELCFNGSSAVLLNATMANDWTHGNSVSLTYDGNLIYSARHQDMVYKIAYANGAGDGHVIWKLGKDGDFTWVSSDPYPWFSHQHDAKFDYSGAISLFDNGNTRVSQMGGNSRGQVLSINEGNLTITPVINADLGGYSLALGAAQRLTNGNYHFGSGDLSGGQTNVVETTSAGTITSLVNAVAVDYRVFRMRDLYSAQ